MNEVNQNTAQTMRDSLKTLTDFLVGAVTGRPPKRAEVEAEIAIAEQRLQQQAGDTDAVSTALREVADCLREALNTGEVNVFRSGNALTEATAALDERKSAEASRMKG